MSEREVFQLKGREAGLAEVKKICDEVAALKAQRSPTLVVLQVGDHAPSNSYIRQKSKSAADFGIRFIHDRLDAKISLADLEATIQKHVDDDFVDGIILQLPLDSATLNEQRTIESLLNKIPPHKDADGLHTTNLGRLFAGESTARNWTSPLPATALGVFRLLDHYKIPIAGRNICVVGKSRLVGMPCAGLLLQEGATVEICHKKTVDLAAHTLLADIVVAAAGARHLIRPEHLKKRAVVIDVGIHAGADGKLTGDMHPDCIPALSAYSPVPGGVGPMTVAMLMENTLRLFMQHEKERPLNDRRATR